MDGSRGKGNLGILAKIHARSTATPGDPAVHGGQTGTVIGLSQSTFRTGEGVRHLGSFPLAPAWPGTSASEAPSFCAPTITLVVGLPLPHVRHRTDHLTAVWSATGLTANKKAAHSREGSRPPMTSLVATLSWAQTLGHPAIA